jgi:hypothetical protein
MSLALRPLKKNKKLQALIIEFDEAIKSCTNRAKTDNLPTA